VCWIQIETFLLLLRPWTGIGRVWGNGMCSGRFAREERFLRARQHARYALTSEADRILLPRHIKKKKEEDGPLGTVFEK
jgi:hypothetical protein